MFMFCTAAPAAPLPRLSKSAVTLMRSAFPQTVMCSRLVPASSFAWIVGGVGSNGLTLTKCWSA